MVILLSHDLIESIALKDKKHTITQIKIICQRSLFGSYISRW